MSAIFNQTKWKLMKLAKVHRMNMNHVWEEDFGSLGFSRYLHSTRKISEDQLIHVGGAGEHSIQIWQHDPMRDQWEKSTLDYNTTGSENSRMHFFMVHNNDFE